MEDVLPLGGPSRDGWISRDPESTQIDNSVQNARNAPSPTGPSRDGGTSQDPKSVPVNAPCDHSPAADLAVKPASPTAGGNSTGRPQDHAATWVGDCGYSDLVAAERQWQEDPSTSWPPHGDTPTKRSSAFTPSHLGHVPDSVPHARPAFHASNYVDFGLAWQDLEYQRLHHRHMPGVRRRSRSPSTSPAKRLGPRAHRHRSRSPVQATSTHQDSTTRASAASSPLPSGRERSRSRSPPSRTTRGHTPFRSSLVEPVTPTEPSAHPPGTPPAPSVDTSIQDPDQEDDPQIDRSFASRLGMLARQFPQQVSCPTPTKPAASMGRLPVDAPPKTPSASLKRTALHAHITDTHMSQLRGLEPSTKRSRPKDAGSLPVGQFLPRPDFRDRHYQMQGEPFRPLAVAVPREFRQLQPHPIPHPAVSLSESEAMDQEVAFRCMVRATNTLEWFLGGATRRAQDVAQICEGYQEAIQAYIQQLHVIAEDKGVTLAFPALPPSPVEAISETHHMLDSASRAQEAVLRQTLHGLHNWILRRRDAQLDKTFQGLSRPERTALREHPLASDTLFDPELCSRIFRDFSQR